MDASYDFLHVSSTFCHVCRQKNKTKILEKITPGQGHVKLEMNKIDS